MRRGALVAACLGATLVTAGPSKAQEDRASRVWEVNGVRLEAAQIDRLAGDIARQTVAAVGRLEGIGLRAEQEPALERIYRDVALDVYGRAVKVVGREDLGDAAKGERIKALVLAGQARSTERVAGVLDADQYRLYRRWEKQQVEAFRRRGLWSSDRRRRGRRR